MANVLKNLNGFVLPHPIIAGAAIGIIGNSIWATYKHWFSPHVENRQSKIGAFQSGFRLASNYHMWSPFFVKRGWEALYNFNSDLLSKSRPQRIILGLVERESVPKELKVDAMGLTFQHPIGLGAGFIRSGSEVEGCFDLGFSFVECGTATLYPQFGNPPRRWWDIPPISLPTTSRERHQHDSELDNQFPTSLTPKTGAIGGFIHNMGQPNQGIRPIAMALRSLHKSAAQTNQKIVGVNIGLSDSVSPLDDPHRYDDYLSMYNIVSPFTHYIVVNVKESEAFQHFENFPNSPLTDDQLAQLSPEQWENPQIFLNELEKDGITAADLERVGLSLPQSIYQLPQQVQHFTMNPNYTQFIENLLRTRDESRSYPDLYTNINDFHYHDHRMVQYYQQKLAALTNEYSATEGVISNALSASLSGLDPQNQDNALALGNIITSANDMDALRERLAAIGEEKGRITTFLTDLQLAETQRHIAHLNSFPTLQYTVDHQAQERYELAKIVLAEQHGEGSPEYEQQLKLLDPQHLSTTSTTPSSSYYRPESIQGYRVYDRSKLNTLGAHRSTLSAIDLSRALQRTTKRTNKPRILFKLASDIEPRLAIVFSKWALLHGVDGIIIGGSATNRNGVLQPDFFPSHEIMNEEVMNRPAMCEADYRDTTITLEPTLEDRAACNHQFHHTPPDQPLQLPNIYQPGYISGPAIRDPTTKLIATVFHHTEGKLPIIGSGGITTAEDVYEKIRAGASLLQINTAFHHDIAVVPKLRNGLNQLIQNDIREFKELNSGLTSSLDQSQKLLFQQLTQHTSPQSPGDASEPVDMGSVSVKDLAALRDEYSSLWTLNKIVGKDAQKLTALVVDPYVECYNEIDNIRREYKRRTAPSPSQD